MRKRSATRNGARRKSEYWLSTTYKKFPYKRFWLSGVAIGLRLCCICLRRRRQSVSQSVCDDEGSQLNNFVLLPDYQLIKYIYRKCYFKQLAAMSLIFKDLDTKKKGSKMSLKI